MAHLAAQKMFSMEGRTVVITGGGMLSDKRKEKKKKKKEKNRNGIKLDYEVVTNT